MSKGNIQINTFRFMMPAEYDFGGQIREGKGMHKNIGFDEVDLATDPETRVPLIDLKKFYDKGKSPSVFLWEALRQSNNVRKWLKHLFAEVDYETFSHSKPGVYWRYLLYLDRESSDFISQNPAVFNEKFTNDRYGPHIALEERGKLLVIRIKEITYEDLYARTRQKIQMALQQEGGE